MNKGLDKKFISSEQLQAIKEACEGFVTSFDIAGLKPKRLEQARKAYGNLYDKQLEIVQTIKKIEMSQLLACNDVILEVLLEEYKELSYCAESLVKEFKAMNQFQEYKEIVNNITEKLKLRDIASMFYHDLIHLQTEHMLDFDEKVFMKELRDK